MRWRCIVCGYIHVGDAPPEICPVCGVDASNFERIEETDTKDNSKEEIKENSSWRCLVCNYVHEGEKPPETCPICGVDSSNFQKEERVYKEGTDSQVELTPEEAIKKAIRSISYGLFIITANYEGKDNGQTANTCFQITSDPVQIAIGINKSNYTHELISKSNKFGVSILDQSGHDLARRFGYKSGREMNKFEGLDVHRGQSGVLLLDHVLATLEAEIVGKIDAGTHTLFLGKVIAGQMLGNDKPMTYDYFRSKK